jgi:N-acyl-D-aspartate/D-glutamate deacylase
MLGGSDAGAHLDRMCGAPYPTAFLRDTLRGRQLVSLERAIQMLTQEPANLFGLRDRGVVREGAYADLVLFDPEEVGASPIRLRADLPGGTNRLWSDPLGVHRVWVNGVVTVTGGEQADDLRPGRLLRSGRDTDTVSARV